ncbi:MAG: DUF4249 domain-containing protein [Cyclobacteriaceae bacterium]|nr:DUF4249 domain-containing protein [Cyclobacteriaceae bacterium]MDX5467646.1 DUF4249 domain-containing protein [Cyclobacteriaceae bacterium]
MKHRSISGLFLGLACFFFSCVDEITIQLKEANEVLVVDAWVGNEPEETYIRVYKTRPFVSSSPQGKESQVKLERIYVERKDGKVFPFYLHKDSLYLSELPIPLMEGETYRLKFSTLEGDTFESAWETVPPKLESAEITSKAIEKTTLVYSGPNVIVQTRTFADVQLQVNDPGKVVMGYFVETSGISEQFTSSLQDNCECACYLPDPNIYPGMNIRSNQSFLGKTIEYSIGEIPLSSLGRYYVNASVKSLTEFGYEYLNQVDLQQRNTGSIFDPAPFRVRGNITGESENSPEVLGGFFLFQKTSFEKLLYRTQIRTESNNLNHHFEPLVQVVATCRDVFPDALPEIPKVFNP